MTAVMRKMTVMIIVVNPSEVGLASVTNKQLVSNFAVRQIKVFQSLRSYPLVFCFAVAEVMIFRKS